MFPWPAILTTSRRRTGRCPDRDLLVRGEVQERRLVGQREAERGRHRVGADLGARWRELPREMMDVDAARPATARREQTVSLDQPVLEAPADRSARVPVRNEKRRLQ